MSILKHIHKQKHSSGQDCLSVCTMKEHVLFNKGTVKLTTQSQSKVDIFGVLEAV